MKKLLVIATLVLGTCLANAQTAKITVDSENPVVTNASGEKFLSYNMHFIDAPQKRYEIGCAFVNADCFKLDVGGNYYLTVLSNDDPNSYACCISFRVVGDGKDSGVFFNPYGKKVKESSN